MAMMCDECGYDHDEPENTIMTIRIEEDLAEWL